MQENSKHLIKVVTMILFSFVIFLYFLSSVFTYSQIEIKSSKCQDLPMPKSVDLRIDQIKILEDYILSNGLELPSRKEAYDSYARENNLTIEDNGYVIVNNYDKQNGAYLGTIYTYYYNLTEPLLEALHREVNNESLESSLYQQAIELKKAQVNITLDDLINRLAYVQANSKGSKASLIGAQGELSDYIDRNGIPAEKLSELFSNICFHEETRTYLIALADNRVGRDYYSLNEVRFIIEKAKEAVRYFRTTENIRRAEWNINHMEFYIKFVSGGYGRYGNRISETNAN